MATTDEIMAGPIEAYVAPLGTAFPDIDEAPASAWILIGAQGSKNITEEGVRLIANDTKEFWRGLGSTGKLKAFRTEEDAAVAFQLADVTAEAISHALGGEAVTAPGEITTTAAGAGQPGQKAVSLLRGFSIREVALLLRKADSPYNAALNMQWEIPRCVAHGQPEIVSVKGAPQVLDFRYELLEDDDDGYGRVLIQTAVATS